MNGRRASCPSAVVRRVSVEAGHRLRAGSHYARAWGRPCDRAAYRPPTLFLRSEWMLTAALTTRLWRPSWWILPDPHAIAAALFALRAASRVGDAAGVVGAMCIIGRSSFVIAIRVDCVHQIVPGFNPVAFPQLLRSPHLQCRTREYHGIGWKSQGQRGGRIPSSGSSESHGRDSTLPRHSTD